MSSFFIQSDFGMPMENYPDLTEAGDLPVVDSTVSEAGYHKHSRTFSRQGCHVASCFLLPLL